MALACGAPAVAAGVVGEGMGGWGGVSWERVAICTEDGKVWSNKRATRPYSIPYGPVQHRVVWSTEQSASQYTKSMGVHNHHGARPSIFTDQSDLVYVR